MTIENPSWCPSPDSGVHIRTQRANGLDFELAEAGSGNHLALCLHGFPELNYSWRHQISLLVQKGYRVWAPNLRGYGASSRPDGVDAYRVSNHMDDIAGLVDASGCEKLTLIAHDWGGALAWQFAMRRIRPIAKLVIMNIPHPVCFGRALRRWPQRRRSWYMGFFQLPWVPEQVLGACRARMIRRAFSTAVRDKSRFTDDDLDIYANAALRPGALTGMVNWYRAAARDGAALFPRPATVDAPVLIIWGEADSALGLETLDGTDEFVSDLTIRRLPGISHWVQQEAPEAVNAILTDWLPDADQNSDRMN